MNLMHVPAYRRLMPSLAIFVLVLLVENDTRVYFETLTQNSIGGQHALTASYYYFDKETLPTVQRWVDGGLFTAAPLPAELQSRFPDVQIYRRKIPWALGSSQEIWLGPPDQIQIISVEKPEVAGILGIMNRR